MTRKDIIRVISQALGLACIPHDLQVHWCCGDTAGDDPCWCPSGSRENSSRWCGGDGSRGWLA